MFVKTLLRDGSRCVFTGALDYATFEAHPSSLIPASGVCISEVAHIITQSLTENITGLSETARSRVTFFPYRIYMLLMSVFGQFQWAKTAAAILERFGKFSAREILGDKGLNNPVNAFTASHDMHVMFDNLNLCLTPAKVC